MTASSQDLIEARGVVKSFGQTPALRGADLQVAAGEMLAVMGPSGSGKSTLLHCLARIFVPDQGEIIFDGQRLDQMDETRRTELRRTAFGFVFQFGQLVPELTAADNIALPLLLGRARRKAAYQTAAQWLSRLGLADKGARRTGELSGGEAQRVAIGRALAGNSGDPAADLRRGGGDPVRPRRRPAAARCSLRRSCRWPRPPCSPRPSPTGCRS
jgi:putative ABC transport system ATP-binding protein